MGTNAGAEAPPAGRGTSDVPNQRNKPRGGNRGRFNNRNDDKAQRPPASKAFTGKEESLGGEFVYQHTNGREASDQYSTTTDEIIRYSSTKYKNGADVERSLSDGEKLVIAMPATPVGAGTPPVIAETDMMIWKMKVQLALQRTAMLESNLESAYALIKGQCSKPILEKIEAQQKYGVTHQSRDPIGLLEIIKSVMFNYNSRKYRAMALIDIIKPDIVSQTSQHFLVMGHCLKWKRSVEPPSGPRKCRIYMLGCLTRLE